METTGLEGAIIIISASLIASITPGAAVACEEPLKRTEETDTWWRCLTKYS